MHDQISFQDFQDANKNNVQELHKLENREGSHK